MMDELDIELDDEEPVAEESQQHFNKYLLSDRINYHLTSSAPEVAAAVDFLCNEIGYKSDRSSVHMRMLVCNLYFNYDNWRKRYTHLCLAKSRFKHLPQYNHFKINYDPLSKCIVHLIMNRYIRRKKGYWNARFMDGYETRLIARGKLIRLLEDRFGVRSHMIHPYPDQQTIIVRTVVDTKQVTFKRLDGSVRRYEVKIKRPIPYPESTNIQGCRNGIKKYNALLGRSFVDIDLAGLEASADTDEIINLSKKTVRRIFTETTRKGGRFYGGWWQQIRRHLRRRIVINGRATAEIDYSGQHIHILYALRDKKLGDKEPYIFSKDNDPENKRPLYKRLMLAGVNARTDRGCIRAVVDEVRSNPQEYPPVTVSWRKFYRQLKGMLAELKEHHREIAKDINSGKGLRAQFIDSEIAYKVITKMTDKDIPILCMHDSFICRDIDAGEVKKAMQEGYVAVLARETSRRKNKIMLADRDVKSKSETITETIEEYKYVQKDTVLHVLNPIFRKSCSYYDRYIEYLASGRTKSIFNYTIRVNEELDKYKKNNSSNRVHATDGIETRQESCQASLIEEVFRLRETLTCNGEHGVSVLVHTGLTAYQGGFCPPAQCLSGFAKLQKISGTAPWVSATGSQKQKTNHVVRKWLNYRKPT